MNIIRIQNTHGSNNFKHTLDSNEQRIHSRSYSSAIFCWILALMWMPADKNHPPKRIPPTSDDTGPPPLQDNEYCHTT